MSDAAFHNFIDTRDQQIATLTATLAAVTTERDAMREALTQLRDHHVARNTQVGRPIADSRTIRIIDIALAAGGSNGK